MLDRKFKKLLKGFLKAFKSKNKIKYLYNHHYHQAMIIWQIILLVIIQSDHRKR